MIARSYFYHVNKRDEDSNIASWCYGLVTVKSFLPKNPNYIMEDIKRHALSDSLDGDKVEITSFNRI